VGAFSFFPFLASHFFVDHSNRLTPKYKNVQPTSTRSTPQPLAGTV
jgi:hypothetical protein